MAVLQHVARELLSEGGLVVRFSENMTFEQQQVAPFPVATLGDAPQQLVHFFCVSDTTGHQPSFGSSMAANFTGKRSTDGRRLRTVGPVPIRLSLSGQYGMVSGIHNSVG